MTTSAKATAPRWIARARFVLGRPEEDGDILNAVKEAEARRHHALRRQRAGRASP